MATTNSTVISTDPLSSSTSSLSSIISTTSSIISSTSTSSSTTSSSTSTSTSSTTLSATTIVSTLTVTRSESSTQIPTTITRTSTSSISTVVPITTSSSATSTPTTIGSGNGNNDGSGGLSTAGKTAVAVVVPVVVVALLVLAGILLYRRRKQKKEAEEARRKEIQDYGYNPNDDPTLPTVMQESHSEMAEDTSGYRGWGAAGAFSNRKTSTTLSGGMTHAQMSDAGSNFYGGGPHSPPIPSPDGNSGDGLVNRRETMGSDDLGALGVAPISASQPIKRGPSNASSAYSNGARSDVSDEQPPLPAGQGYGDYYNNGAQYGSYTQHGPYGDGSYGGAQENGMPVVRDVSARRNTRIQQGGTYQQANSGIAQNF